jgi:hypothetical protein
MSEQRLRSGSGRTSRTVLVLGLALWCGAFSGRAEDTKAGDRRPAGRCLSGKGTLLRRSAPDKPWEIVSKPEAIYDGDLVLGLPGGQLGSRNWGVRLSFWTDMDRLSPHPVRESAVVLHRNQDVDMDFTLDRGRIELTNRKEKGPARVLAHVRKETWDLTLEEPGASIALELYGRWPAGAKFTMKPGPKDVPTASLTFYVLKGDVSLKHGGTEFAMRAPPGPAMIEWDSVTGQDETPRFLKELPPWVGKKEETTPEGKARRAALERFRKLVLSKSLGAALDNFLNSDKEIERTLAVTAMGAVDDLERLGKALREAKHPDVWDNGVLALRHWIGRCPGQDQTLYKRLVDLGYPAIQAATVMQLLHSFGEENLARPELYHTLMDFLEHDKLAIRGLAYWHLSRLVPEGKEFKYNPLDPKEKRDKAIAKWKKLIPEGQMPPKPKTNAKDK